MVLTQGVREIHTLAEQAQGLADAAGLLHVDVGEPQQVLHDLDDPGRIESIEGPEHPFQL